MGGPATTLGCLKRLRGRIHLVWGNHDRDEVRALPNWASSQPYAEIKIDGEFIILCHYAMRVWNRSHFGSFHFYGHTHGVLPGVGRSIDVEVDCWDFRPIRFEEIRARLVETHEIDRYGVTRQKTVPEDLRNRRRPICDLAVGNRDQMSASRPGRQRNLAQGRLIQRQRRRAQGGLLFERDSLLAGNQSETATAVVVR